MRRRRASRGLQWRGRGEPGAPSDSPRWWWSRSSIPGPVSAPPTAVVRTDLCVGCGQCASACPAGAISLSSEGKAVVAASLCRGCGACMQVCPTGAVRMSEPTETGHPGEVSNDQGSMRTKRS
ncbi:MAG: 4Fe-4S binding protein [Proteobacteria bacterium]|nr:4Fe-4S binding protein [Pseudomonadota bacterium]